MATTLAPEEIRSLEYAKNDDDLIERIANSESIKIHQGVTLPSWMGEISPVDGFPFMIPAVRLEALDEGQPALDDDERRLVRNRTAIEYVVGQIERAPANNSVVTTDTGNHSGKKRKSGPNDELRPRKKKHTAMPQVKERKRNAMLLQLYTPEQIKEMQAGVFGKGKMSLAQAFVPEKVSGQAHVTASGENADEDDYETETESESGDDEWGETNQANKPPPKKQKTVQQENQAPKKNSRAEKRNERLRTEAYREKKERKNERRPERLRQSYEELLQICTPEQLEEMRKTSAIAAKMDKKHAQKPPPTSTQPRPWTAQDMKYVKRTYGFPPKTSAQVEPCNDNANHHSNGNLPSTASQFQRWRWNDKADNHVGDTLPLPSNQVQLQIDNANNYMKAKPPSTSTQVERWQDNVNGHINGNLPSTSIEVQRWNNDEVEDIKGTVLAPFYERMCSDHNTIVRLQLENHDLKAHLTQPLQQAKPGLPMTPPDNADDQHGEHFPASQTSYQPLADLVKSISEELDQSSPSETIHLCGLAPLHLITTRPLDVLQLAYERLHTWKYDNVPVCWRRLYEEASLHIAVKLLKELSIQSLSGMSPAKRDQTGSDFQTRIAEIAKNLDGAIIVAGAPARKALIVEVLRQLDTIMRFLVPQSLPNRLPIPNVESLDILSADLHSEVKRAKHVWGVDEFQVHLQNNDGPVVIPQSFTHWPANKLWQDLTYLKRRTLGGHRIVPVELGTSYNEEDWSQKMMTFGEFAEKFLLPEAPEQMGYLAQHDLFTQVPDLKNDISIPDYCYTSPPPPQGAAANTPGLLNTMQLNEPLLNAWLGPRGTKTPLHTDPYHNILCQVVGYKYVRLYPPSETPKLYPQGITEAGIPMENNSQVDIWDFVPRRGKHVADPRKIHKLREKFPLFETAEYQEVVLGPGECLYIPLGYWHYVESLTTSFSVSFWWN